MVGLFGYLIMTLIRHHGRVDQERAEAVGGKRGLRPFPAIDPEPSRRYTWRTARRAGIACLAACAVAAAATAGVRLAADSSASHPGPSHPARPAAAPAARFTDGDGLIVFEEQPSGLLGTAEPDGSHLAARKSLGGLQGEDLPVASPDGRYLVTDEGQLVTLGPNGPSAITTLDQAAAGESWQSASFADGSRYVAVVRCDTGTQSAEGPVQAWVAYLLPTGGGKPAAFGIVTSAAGAPASAGALVAVPVTKTGAAFQYACYGPESDSDASLDLAVPGRPPQVIVTAAALVRAAGWPASTPVQLSATPSPDGKTLLVGIAANVPRPPNPSPGRLPKILAAQFLLAATGTILSRLPGSGLEQVAWSPDGTRIATCLAVQGQPSTVSVLTVSAAGKTGSRRTIVLPGRHDLDCLQLLWSPDGTQLIYSAVANSRGLTQSDRLQHGWTVIDLRTGKAHDVTAPGQPAAWLPIPKSAAPKSAAS